MASAVGRRTRYQKNSGSVTKTWKLFRLAYFAGETISHTTITITLLLHRMSE
jgi:hypothetical protein